MNATFETLDSLLRTLLEEERVLTTLVALALEEQQALVISDYEAIESVSQDMQAAAASLEELEVQREALLRAMDARDATLADVVPTAHELGVAGFGEARERLIERATELQEAQERNARLILNAVKLRERWFNLLGGVGGSSTYGSGGRQDASLRRGFVSRSA